MAETNGRWKFDPKIALTLAAAAITLGANFAYLEVARRDIADMKQVQTTLANKEWITLLLQQADEIHKSLREDHKALDSRVSAIERRISTKGVMNEALFVPAGQHLWLVRFVPRPGRAEDRNQREGASGARVRGEQAIFWPEGSVVGEAGQQELRESGGFRCYPAAHEARDHPGLVWLLNTDTFEKVAAATLRIRLLN